MAGHPRSPGLRAVRARGDSVLNGSACVELVLLRLAFRLRPACSRRKDRAIQDRFHSGVADAALGRRGRPAFESRAGLADLLAVSCCGILRRRTRLDRRTVSIIAVADARRAGAMDT